jgi:hypothetical protein
MIDVLIVIGIEIGIIVFVVWIVWAAAVGAPWVPTPRSKVRRMLEFAEVNKGDLLYDLGSGDGRIVVMAAQEFGAKSIGIEVDPVRVLWSRFVIWRRRLQHRAEIIRRNLFSADLSDATVVTLYQGHNVNKRIRDKLDSCLKPGTRVVSYRFLMTGWTPAKTDEDSSIYLYVV